MTHIAHILYRFSTEYLLHATICTCALLWDPELCLALKIKPSLKRLFCSCAVGNAMQCSVYVQCSVQVWDAAQSHANILPHCQHLFCRLCNDLDIKSHFLCFKQTAIILSSSLLKLAAIAALARSSFIVAEHEVQLSSNATITWCHGSCVGFWVQHALLCLFKNNDQKTILLPCAHNVVPTPLQMVGGTHSVG